MKKVIKWNNVNKQNKNTVNKIFNKFTILTSILILVLALALSVNAATVRVQSGALNVSNNLLVNTNTLYVDSTSNNVGIGTTAPNHKLVVVGGNVIVEDDGNGFMLRDTAGDKLFRMVVGAGGDLLFQNDAGSSLGVWKQGGNVGIGTTSPTSPLTVGSGAGTWEIESVGNNYFDITTPETTGGGITLRTRRASGPAIHLATNGDVYLVQDAGSGKVGIGTTSPASTLTVIGNFSATGAKAAVINTSQGAVAFYAMESTEVRLYDEGISALTNGAATVTLDPLFAEVIDTSDYIVHLTPRGNSNGLYVAAQTPTSFTVKENNAGTSSTEFSYLISGKRKAFKDVRLYKISNFDFGNQT